VFSPTTQAVTKRARINKAKSVFVKVQNDGAPGTIIVFGAESHEDLKLE
jgi:hypothetical protein